MTWACFTAVTEEAWCAITPEWFSAAGSDPQGVNLYGLGQDFAAMTGQPNPFPAPLPPAPVPPVPVPPAPVPVPVPVPPAPGADPDVSYGFDPQLIAWAARPHGMAGNRYAAERYNAWRAAKGYVGA